MITPIGSLVLILGVILGRVLMRLERRPPPLSEDDRPVILSTPPPFDGETLTCNGDGDEPGTWTHRPNR